MTKMAAIANDLIPPNPVPSPGIIIEFCDRVSAHPQRTLSISIHANVFSSVAGTHYVTYSQGELFRHKSIRLHRATWLSTELFLTFPPPALKGITLLPLNDNETAGRFRVWLSIGSEPPILIWDRKTEGGFPELKELVSSPNFCTPNVLNRMD